MSLVLLLRADSEDVVVSINDGDKQLVIKEWKAGRELSTQLLGVINELCVLVNATTEKLTGIIVYQGPGSYTGLRISISVANALGYSLNIPVIGVGGSDWAVNGLEKLAKTEGFAPVSPTYGGDVYTTKPKK